MYNVLTAIKNNMLLQELKRLHIWGASTGFEICEVTSDFVTLTEHLRKNKYQLVLLEATPDYPVLNLLQTIRQEKLCQAIAMVGQTAEFKIVRKSFLLGVDDYLITPFEISQFISLFGKIEHAEYGKIEAENSQKESLLDCFRTIDFSIKKELDNLLYHALSEYSDPLESFSYLKRILDDVTLELFRRHPWLELYFQADDFILPETDFPDCEEQIQKSVDDFYSLFTEFAELYPAHSEGMDKILLYILNRPEEDLKQKTISEELYINRSYFSTMFTAQMQINFVDYVNIVKMKRAAYLLKHTKRKVIDIAGALDYKDMGYFLKKFKAKYGVTPSQYRTPETYEFQI